MGQQVDDAVVALRIAKAAAWTVVTVVAIVSASKTVISIHEDNVKLRQAQCEADKAFHHEGEAMWQAAAMAQFPRVPSVMMVQGGSGGNK